MGIRVREAQEECFVVDPGTRAEEAAHFMDLLWKGRRRVEDTPDGVHKVVEEDPDLFGRRICTESYERDDRVVVRCELTQGGILHRQMLRGRPLASVIDEVAVVH